jgi:hypothetical protein
VVRARRNFRIRTKQPASIQKRSNRFRSRNETTGFDSGPQKRKGLTSRFSSIGKEPKLGFLSQTVVSSNPTDVFFNFFVARVCRHSRVWSRNAVTGPDSGPQKRNGLTSRFSSIGKEPKLGFLSQMVVGSNPTDVFFNFFVARVCRHSRVWSRKAVTGPDSGPQKRNGLTSRFSSIGKESKFERLSQVGVSSNPTDVFLNFIVVRVRRNYYFRVWARNAATGPDRIRALKNAKDRRRVLAQLVRRPSLGVLARRL